MSSRIAFPHAYDPHMYSEDVVTLARTTSQHAASKGNGNLKTNTSGPQPAMASASPASASPASAFKALPISPQRRKFVFTDPVAFRYLAAKCERRPD
jgi:hypothetical protein